MILQWRDTYQLVSKLSLKRLKNAINVWLSYHISRFSGIPRMKGLPISISIEPTTACNLRCPECPSGLRSFTRPTGKLDESKYEQLIDQISAHTLYLTFYFQGEPYLHPGFLEMVKYASGKRMYTATSTNAHYLNKETAIKTVQSGLDRLIISIDGMTQQTYESYRIGGQLQKVLDATQNIIAAKKQLKSNTPTVVWQYLVVRPNEHEIPLAKRLATKYGVDHLAFKTAQVYDFVKGNELIPTVDKYSRYRLQTTGKYEIKNPLYNHCWKMWHSSVVTWDGKVLPCCFDKDAHHVLGSVTDATFGEIWHSEAYLLFRSKLLKGRSQIDICNNCTEGTKVWG